MNENSRVKDKLLGRGIPEGSESILKGRRMDFEFMPVRIAKVEGVPLAVVFLPMADSAAEKTLAETCEVFSRDSQSYVIVGGSWGSLCEGSFQIQADPYITRQKVSPLVPTGHWFEAENVHIELKRPIQIRNRKGDVIDTRDHGFEPITPCVEEVQL